MKVKILGFGIVKDIFESASIELQVKDGNSIRYLKNELEKTFPKLRELSSYMIAKNNEYAEEDDRFSARDEIAIIPPVSGG